MSSPTPAAAAAADPLQTLLNNSTFSLSAKPSELTGAFSYAGHAISAALQSALEYATGLGYKLDFTAITGGSHLGGTTDPHYLGNAADIGAVNGSTNPASWYQFLVSQITGNRLLQNGGTIGTEASLAFDPNLKALAAEHGVNLIEDDVATGASGPHIHLQVSGDAITLQPSELQKLLAKNPGLAAKLNAIVPGFADTIGNPAGAIVGAITEPFKISGIFIGSAILAGVLILGAIIWAAAGSGSAAQIAEGAQSTVGKASKGALQAALLALK